MDKIHLKNEFADAFQPFCEEFGLVPIWHSDTLLNFEPLPASARAKVHVSFEPAYWVKYEAHNSAFRFVARALVVAEVLGQRAGYRQLGLDDAFAVHIHKMEL